MLLSLMVLGQKEEEEAVWGGGGLLKGRTDILAQKGKESGGFVREAERGGDCRAPLTVKVRGWLR